LIQEEFQQHEAIVNGLVKFGGTAEEEAADIIKSTCNLRPVVSYIAALQRLQVNRKMGTCRWQSLLAVKVTAVRSLKH